MRVRGIAEDSDWLFGKGQNDYVQGREAVVQNVSTRLNEVLGDCFFNNPAGVNWFVLLGEKDQTALNLAISSVILNTQDVTGLTQLNAELTSAREFRVQYEVSTTYGTAADSFVFNASNL